METGLQSAKAQASRSSFWWVPVQGQQALGAGQQAWKQLEVRTERQLGQCLVAAATARYA
jgi:hypothetical protein